MSFCKGPQSWSYVFKTGAGAYLQMGVEPLAPGEPLWRLWPSDLSVIPAAHSTDLCSLNTQVPRARLVLQLQANQVEPALARLPFLWQKHIGSARVETYRAQRRKSTKEETRKAPNSRMALEEIRGDYHWCDPPILPQTEKFQ